MTRARDLADIADYNIDSNLDVTGTVNISNSSGATLKLTSTDTTGADTELLGQIDFVSSDTSTGSAGTQARIKGVYEDNGDSSGIAFLTGASTGSGTPTIAEVMRIRHEGNVGIGTTSPSEKVTINGSFRAASQDWQMQILNPDTAAANKGGGIAFGGSYTGTTQTYFSNILGAKENGTAGNLAGYLSFYTRSSGAGYTAERMRIDSSGNVGIGASSPATKLEVSGAVSSTGTGAGNAAFKLQEASNNPWYLMQFTGGAFSLNYNGTTGGASTLLVDSSGNVGIGTTSPAFSFDVRGNVSSNYLAYFKNDGNNSNRYGVLIAAGADSGSGTLMGFTDGDGTGVGGITFSGGTVTYGAFTAQHPCIIPDADNDPDSDSPAYPYGTLLETTSLSYTPKSDGTDSERGIRYHVRKTQTANSKAVLGAYGCSMNGGPENQTNEHQALVLGDGHILCNNSGGNIEMGDGICSSAVVGIGQKATASPSMIIGIAQEAVTFSSDTETKLVAVQYGLQQFTPW